MSDSVNGWARRLTLTWSTPWSRPAATEQLSGDPLWLLVVSGPGAGKTEILQTLVGAGAHLTSTIASEGALLSASPKKSQAKDATGGLLRKIGGRGVLVIKDFTSILSAAREMRGMVLAAIREVYDGYWERNVGSDGGRSLAWRGRIIVIGAVTTAWDMAHSVVAAMGDRFVLVRIDSQSPHVRAAASQMSTRNTGREVEMREELASLVGALLNHVDTEEVTLSESENEQLQKAAEIVTMARTAVERSSQGHIIDAHAPEMPTRFAKQLTQVVRGGVAIGLERAAALRLAIRCARDSIPPLRRHILLDVAANPMARVNETCERICKPWTTVRREMEALTTLGVLTCTVETDDDDQEGNTKRKYIHDLAEGFDRKTLLAMNGLEVPETETANAAAATLSGRPAGSPHYPAKRDAQAPRAAHHQKGRVGEGTPLWSKFHHQKSK